MMKNKIYCTQCGREIKEGLLYCDRCGQSVKKSIEKQNPKTEKQQQIEALQQERKSRQEKRNQREKKRMINKEKHKKNVKILLFIVGILIIALVSAVISYIKTQPTIKEVDDVVLEDAENMATIPPSSQQTSTASTVNTDFKTIEANGIVCPYPETFTESANGIGEVLHLSDSVGGAVMVIAKDSPSGEAKDLMSEYAAHSGGNVTFSRAGDNWYAVTVTAGEQITHRKYVIKNGLALYYDFTYDTSSASLTEYEECITNLDENFNG